MAERFDQLDTAIRMVTPENIAFEYRLAGPFRRLCAYLIDLALRTIFIVSLLFILAMSSPIFQQLFDFGAIGLGMMFVVWFLLDWFYGGTLEALWNGQTPGKWLFGLRVLGVDGQPISGWQAVLRNFLRALDAMPTPWYILGLVTAACNRRFQRLGDLAAGTMVVVEQKAPSIGLIRLTDPEVLELAARLPAKFEANRSLGRALSRYVARRSRFSWRRRCEIAWHLAEPLRQLLDLPPTTNPDVLLCAVYHRAFISHMVGDEPIAPVTPAAPLAPAPAVIADVVPPPGNENVFETDEFDFSPPPTRNQGAYA